ncbi:unnamed protein product, partial [Iphiclides podalirius]
MKNEDIFDYIKIQKWLKVYAEKIMLSKVLQCQFQVQPRKLKANLIKIGKMTLMDQTGMEIDQGHLVALAMEAVLETLGQTTGKVDHHKAILAKIGMAKIGVKMDHHNHGTKVGARVGIMVKATGIKEIGLTGKGIGEVVAGAGLVQLAQAADGIITISPKHEVRHL